MSQAHLYDIAVKQIDGVSTTLDTWRGDVLLVVNVASKCGLTPQYEGLEALYQRWRDKGFTILGFPANDFLAQERQKVRLSAPHPLMRQQDLQALARDRGGFSFRQCREPVHAALLLRSLFRKPVRSLGTAIGTSMPIRRCAASW